MGSWIECRCGRLIHTNLFAGTGIYKLISKSDYDSFHGPIDRDMLEELFFKKGATLYRCTACGRLALEWRDDEAPFFYVPERKKLS